MGETLYTGVNPRELLIGRRETCLPTTPDSYLTGFPRKEKEVEEEVEKEETDH